jgi:S-DNA-T family DNA segregation ATPase FtsK/SpoIIIE
MEAERHRKRTEKHLGDVKAARSRALDTGDIMQFTQLTDQMRLARHVRVDTAQKWFELGWSVFKRTGAVFGIGLAVLLGVGVINSFGGWLGQWDALDVLHTIGAIAATTAAIVRWTVGHWWLFVLVAVVVWLSRRWRDGNRLGEQVLPGYLRKQGTSVTYVELSESAMTHALANIGNAKLNAAIKDGWPNRDTDNAWVQFPMLAPNAKGWSTKMRLPSGVPVAGVAKAREVLAHNLNCRPQELFIESDEHDPTVMDLFRLDPGVLREPVPPYPLLEEGSTDFLTGFPVGITPRGDVVTAPVNERNHVYAGVMGSGKTTLVLNVLFGAILDPLMDVDVFLFAENADYEALRPCLNTFVMGDTPENVQACMEHIQTLHADLTNRGRLLQKHGVKSVEDAGRDLIAKEPGLRPRIVVIDECQAFFRQDKPEDRKAVINTMVRFYSAARKYGITIVFLTPVPSDQSLPRDLVAVTTNRACGAIGDKLRNNVVLGEKAHESGISALGLKPKTKTALNDTGTLVTVGFMDNPGPVRSFYLTRDQQQQVTARALELRGGTVRQAGPQIETRDWLADLAQVCHTDQPKVKLTDAAGWMRKLAPHYQPYQSLDGKTLAQWLDEVGVPVSWPARQPHTVTQSIHTALHERGPEPQ